MRREITTRGLLIGALFTGVLVGSVALVGAQSAGGGVDATIGTHAPGEPTSLTVTQDVSQATATDDLQQLVIRSNGVDFSDAGIGSVSAFGIDRGGDDPGTQTDQTLITEVDGLSTETDRIRITLERSGERGLGVQPGDELVAAVDQDGDGNGEPDVVNDQATGIYDFDVTVDDGPTATDSLLIAPLKPLCDTCSVPTDGDDDSRFEDINGDGEFDVVDVQLLFLNRDADSVRTNPGFDFDGDGDVDVVDVQQLFVTYT